MRIVGDLDILLTAGRDKVKVFGAWLDADIAGRKAGQGNRAAGLIARADRGEELSDQEIAEVRCELGFMPCKRAAELGRDKRVKANVQRSFWHVNCSKFGEKWLLQNRGPTSI